MRCPRVNVIYIGVTHRGEWPSFCSRPVAAARRWGGGRGDQATSVRAKGAADACVDPQHIQGRTPAIGGRTAAGAGAGRIKGRGVRLLPPCVGQGTARSAGEVASSAERQAPSKSAWRVFDKGCRRAQFRRGPFVSGVMWGSSHQESSLSAAPKSSGARNRASPAAARRWRRVTSCGRRRQSTRRA